MLNNIIFPSERALNSALTQSHKFDNRGRRGAARTAGDRECVEPWNVTYSNSMTLWANRRVGGPFIIAKPEMVKVINRRMVNNATGGLA
ncbi:MAG TPA: hypothetical protein VFP68_08750 [Burkholderiaceae bacterium]|nr:hypothetical protein [Burkholderiaceae bacterium]